MYKVNEAADALGVTRVEVFEILLSQRERFEPFVVKQNSITYISEEGLKVLSEILDIARGKKTDHLGAETETNGPELDAVEPAVPESNLPEHGEAESEEALLEAPFTAEARDSAFERPAIKDVETEDDLIGQWLREIQAEDAEADAIEEKLRALRAEVTQMRNKILSLDSEIKRKDEAVRHYHEIMKDDLRWLEDLERKTQLVVKHGMTEAALPGAEAPEGDKGNFFKRFKR